MVNAPSSRLFRQEVFVEVDANGCNYKYAYKAVKHSEIRTESLQFSSSAVGLDNEVLRVADYSAR